MSQRWIPRVLNPRFAVLFAAAVVGCGSSPRSQVPDDAAEVGDELPDQGVADTPPVAELPSAEPASAASAAAKTPTPKLAHPELAACEAGEMEPCNNVGVSLVKGDGVAADPQNGVAFMERSCDGGYALGCFNAALMHFKGDQVKGDLTKALQHFDKACALKHARACMQSGAMHLDDRGGAPDGQRALQSFDKGCALGEATSCRNMGIVLAQGESVPADGARALTYFAKGCKAGDEQSCDFEKELSKPAAPTVKGANLSMGELSADGLTLKDLSCRADGLGFLGGILIAGGLSKRKSQLDRCAPNGADPSVRWSFAGNRITSVTVTGESAAVNACVKRIVKSASIPGSGECVATLKIGR